MSSRALGAVAAEALDAVGQIDRIAAEAALDENGGEIRRIARLPALAGAAAPCARGAAAAAGRAGAGPSP